MGYSAFDSAYGYHGYPQNDGYRMPPVPYVPDIIGDRDIRSLSAELEKERYFLNFTFKFLKKRQIS